MNEHDLQQLLVSDLPLQELIGIAYSKFRILQHKRRECYLQSCDELRELLYPCDTHHDEHTKNRLLNECSLAGAEFLCAEHLANQALKKALPALPIGVAVKLLNDPTRVFVFNPQPRTQY